MVLTRIVLNLSSAAARRDLTDPYEMHSTLMRLVDAGSSKPLWRLEAGRGAQPPILLLVQTERTPDPRALSADGDPYFESFETRENRLLEAIATGSRLNFRVRANPTVTRDGKRHGLVRHEDQMEWISRQVTRAGSDLVSATPLEVRREVLGRKRRTNSIVLTGVTFDGVMDVRNPEALRETVRKGIGHARSLGFGLLTIAR
jgi:CRISPR system Cascade subunit CasE